MIVTDNEKALEVMRALSDEYSRKILLSIISMPLPIDEISKEQRIPISTCYRRVHELQSFGILKAEKTVIQDDGKKFVCYRSSIRNALISMESGELVVDVTLNKEIQEKPSVTSPMVHSA